MSAAAMQAPLRNPEDERAEADGVGATKPLRVPQGTGAHIMKLGYQGTYYDERTSFTNNQQLMYRVNNGVPNHLTMAVPFTQSRAPVQASPPFTRRSNGRSDG